MKTVNELEEGEVLVQTRSICKNCLEPIYFGTCKRPSKTYDKHYDGWKHIGWKHEATNGANCVTTFAEPLSGHILQPSESEWYDADTHSQSITDGDSISFGHGHSLCNRECPCYPECRT